MSPKAESRGAAPQVAGVVAPPPPGPPPPCIRAAPSGVYISIRAKPGARQGRVVAITDEAVEVSIDAPAREGEANIALLELLAAALGIRRREVSLSAGSRGRDKAVLVEGAAAGTPEAVYHRLWAAIQSG